MSAVIESKHTPGPWVVNEGRYAHITNGLYRGQIAWLESHQDPDDPMSPPLYVCEPNNRGVESVAESLANARLIAAAPDMYGALQVLREYFEETVAEHPPEAFRPVTLLRRALAKAEGRES